jgi:transmembrane sensor
MTLQSRFSRSRTIERKAYRWVMKMLDDPTRHALDLERWLSADDEYRAVFKRVAIEVGYASDAASLSHKMKAVLADVHHRQPRRYNASWIAASAAIVAATLVAAVYWHVGGSRSYPDVPREEAPRTLSSGDAQKFYALADSSKVTLLANSVLRVHYTTEERGIDLTSGRARFEVEHDTARPFTVYVRGGKVTAVGTVFDVDASAPVAKVHLITGRVVVTISSSSANEAPRAVTLTSGQEISLGQALPEAQSPAKDVPAIVKTETFDDVPLSVIVGRANVLSPLKITLADPTMGSQLIFAELNLSDIRSVARKLAVIVGGTVDESDGQLKIVRIH